jgi:hypothetical protein
MSKSRPAPQEPQQVRDAEAGYDLARELFHIL